MKKVISFSLWGDNLKYTIGAIKNAKIASSIYPDWICRFYIAKSVPNEILIELYKAKNTELFIMNEFGDWNGMFWRFFSADDPSVDIMISRDTDSRLSIREKLAVDEWLSSNKDFHIMRDHPYHAAPILGGMWGVRNGLLNGIIKEIERYSKGNFWQIDQNFLKEKIYPFVKDKSIVHDDFFEKKPFPQKRSSLEFVGQAFDENDATNDEHVEILKKSL